MLSNVVLARMGCWVVLTEPAEVIERRLARERHRVKGRERERQWEGGWERGRDSGRGGGRGGAPSPPATQRDV